VNDLEVPDFVQEDVVEHETAHRDRRPLHALHRPEHASCLTFADGAIQAHVRRKGAKRDLAPPTCRRVSEAAISAGLVVEMDSTDAVRQLRRETRQNHFHVCFVDVVASITTGLPEPEFQSAPSLEHCILC
jgi:hypothetical protein